MDHGVVSYIENDFFSKVFILKTSKSPSKGMFILEIMFNTGLRITADLIPDMKLSNLFSFITNEVHKYRKGDDYQLQFLSLKNVITKYLSHDKEKIDTELVSSGSLNVAIGEGLLYVILHGMDPRRRVQLNSFYEFINSYYE